QHPVHLSEEVTDIVGQLDEYRARLAPGGDAVGFIEGGNHLGMAEDAKAGLGDGLEQAVLINVMQLVAPTVFTVDTTGNDQHGDTIQPRLADTTGRMGHTGCGHDSQGAY